MTLELDPGEFRFRAKFAEVIDFAVKDDLVAGNPILHGWCPSVERSRIANLVA
jgi:hypothetical protein